MNHLPEILLSNLFLVVVWAFFELGLRNTRNFHASRFFLLAGAILAAVLPWIPWQIRIPVHTAAILGIPMAPAGEIMAGNPMPAIQAVAVPNGTPVNWPAVVYFTVIALLTLTFLAQTVRMFLWTRRRPVARWDRYRVVEMNKSWPAFSFFGTIYFPEPFEPDKRETITILEHERVHARQLHSVDNLLLLVLRILFFYNPAIHLLAGRMRLTHEFLADAETAGADKAEYSQTLIRHQFLVPRLLLMHSFNNQSFLKRRLDMLMKSNTRGRAAWIYLLALPLLAGMFLLSGWSASAQDPQKGQKDDVRTKANKQMEELGFSKTSDTTWTKDGITATLVEKDGLSRIEAGLKRAEEEKEALMAAKKQGKDDASAIGQGNPVKKEKKVFQVVEDMPGYQGQEKQDRKVFLIVEDMPTFGGGTIENFRQWFQSTVKYPDTAKEKKISGTVYVSFIVDTTGRAVDPQILRSADPILDAEVLRVLCSAPLWKPGKQRGRLVNVSFSIPVKFLPDGAEDEQSRKDFEAGKISLNEYNARINGVATTGKVIRREGNTVYVDGVRVETSAKTFLIVEEMPTFQGGTIDDFRNWVQDHIKYPAEAKANKTEGTVYVSFVIDTLGSPVSIEIIRSAGPDLDAEVVRVIKSSPVWKSGKQRGKAVNVSFSIPVSFALSKSGEMIKPPKPQKAPAGKDHTVEGGVDDSKVFLIVEEMPEFEGGKIDKFIGWVQAHVKYPPIAMENNITGTVYVSFIVDREGKVKDITILKSVDPALDDAVVSVLKTAPDWKPGRQRGETVNVSFSIPVKFNLN